MSHGVGTLHISCAAEGSYVAHSAATIHSVLSNNGTLDVRVHYLHGANFDPDDAQRLTAMVEAKGASICFYRVTDDELSGLPSDARFTSAMWHRLFLPQLVPHLTRILYLDADTLACDSLESLWQTELGDSYVAAVTNAFQPNHRTRPKRLGLPSRDLYFNSGVLLMNLDRMRRDQITEALVSLVVERGSEFEWPDQDALNVVLHRGRLPLHPRWNSMNALRREWSRGTFGRLARRRAVRHPGIRHFEGPGANKPWHPACEEPQRELYLMHLRQTPWGEGS